MFGMVENSESVDTDSPKPGQTNMRPFVPTRLQEEREGDGRKQEKEENTMTTNETKKKPKFFTEERKEGFELGFIIGASGMTLLICTILMVLR